MQDSSWILDAAGVGDRFGGMGAGCIGRVFGTLAQGCFRKEDVVAGRIELSENQCMMAIADKMAAWGVGSLTDQELLAGLVGDERLAEALLGRYEGSLVRLFHEKPARLRMIEGLGLRRMQLLLLAAELGRRVAAQEDTAVETVNTSEDIVRLFRPLLGRLDHEECWVLYLTASNRIIERQRVSQGGVTATVVDHRLIIKRALELLATQLILVHNHPSGSAEASVQDQTLTEKVCRAAALFDIRLLDHLIVSREGDYSFRRAGLLK